MHNITNALMSTVGDLVAAEARSALPDAPVQAAPAARVHPPRTARTRRVMAGALHRAADAVSPA
jgi:hypothetical protein